MGFVSEWNWKQFCIGLGMVERKYAKFFVIQLGFFKVWWELE